MSQYLRICCKTIVKQEKKNTLPHIECEEEIDWSIVILGLEHMKRQIISVKKKKTQKVNDWKYVAFLSNIKQ